MPPTPRKLTTHQKQVLIQVLLAFPDQQAGICYSPSAPDAADYAQDFLAIFKALNWTVTGPECADLLDGHSAGLALVVGQQAVLPASAEALRDALRVYSIEVQTFHHPTHTLPPNAFTLVIG